ncbi:adhesin protein Mad1 [Pyricularia oryzae 70-15]|uniref:Adhesin protein Mad1 n=3 Tax=Pyricularia oryzae TaxID=318829 RepID=G4NKJ7_PYRO7|nr:adhesin protein Mad1 [Pyricularia oryzae 70-15]EHA45872.1 adhesin protein Mad1 [Pyricularia oryzae 70-15]ELQ41027.1 adhesin protein Mad1 [Pyricularia oryzae Y34]KAI7922802.1 adhesin protein Mad1 [Pyricularia oryzae]
MKTFTFLSLVAGATATFKGANPFECPSNTDNQCKPKQAGGFNWSDLNPGKFSSYDDFNFKGWECKEDKSFTRRGHFDRRTSGKVIDGRASSNKGDCPSFDSKDKFSLDTFHMSTEFDCDLEFHYGMPDGSTCRQRSPCKKSGSTIKNTQCGGAKGVTIVYPPQPNKPKKDCGITVTSVSFDCSTRPPKPTSSVKTSSQPPKVTTTSQPPKATTESSKPPKETSQPPKETSSLPPKVTTTSQPPQITSASSLPPKDTTSQPPKDTSSKPPKDTTSQPPKDTTSQPPKGTGSASVPPPQGTASNSVPPPQGTASNSVPPPQGTASNSVPPQGTASASQPPKDTVSQPPAATTSITSTMITIIPSTSTVFTTKVSTVFSCAEDVKDCPGRSTTAVITVSVPVSTTVTQITETKTTVLPPVTTPGLPGSPVTTPGAPATTPGAPGTTPGAPGTTVNVPGTTVNVPGTTVTAPGPVVTLPCPDVVPKCLNTWIFQLGCKDNTDSNCYCPDTAFVENVFQCFYAHGESDSVISEAVIYFQGICAPHIPQNPAIITGPTITSYITVTAPPTPIATNPAAITTISVDKTTVVPCTDDAGNPIPSSSSTVTISTTIVVPKLGFTTAPPAPGATGPAGGSDNGGDIGLVPVTTAIPIVTGTAPGSGASPTGGNVPGVPAGTGVPPRPSTTGTIPVKAAGERVYASLALAAMAVVAAL